MTTDTRPLFDTKGYSMTAFEGIRLQDPTGPLADDSIKRVADQNFLRGRYEDAAYNYDLIRKEYPHSEHYMESQLLGLQSKMLSYQGPQYDSKPLEDAEKLCKDTLVQVNPAQAAERERLLAALGGIGGVREASLERLNEVLPTEVARAVHDRFAPRH